MIKEEDKNIKVTIAVPIYNARSFLQDAIQSVLNQTYKNWVLYLINDGSTDGSLSVIQEFAAKDSRICVVNDGQNRGLIFRLNQSISLCKTKYYARMDADDIMCQSRIEEQVRFLEAHPDVDVCGTSIMTIDSDNNIIGSGLSEGKVSGFVHPTVMGKTSWFKANPYADWALRAEDFELWSRTAKYSNFYAIGKPLLFYREFGVPTFKKYYLSQKTIIKITSKYKLYSKPFSWFIRNSLSACAKILINAFFVIIKKEHILISMRKRTPIAPILALNERDLSAAIKKN